MQACREQHRVAQLNLEESGLLYCPPSWDTLLCWPPARAGQVVHLPCPPLKGIDPTKWAERTCLEDGRWQLSPEAAGALLDQATIVEEVDKGWTNYNSCFLPEIRDLMKQLEAGTQLEAEKKMMVAQVTRILEVTGLTISLISLIVSLFIFTYFRSLQNHRTRIHKNLFAAIGIQVIIRLTLYMDQAVSTTAALTDVTSLAGSSVDQLQNNNGIHTTPILCEMFYIVLEYARTTMFIWMFIEGLFLHNLITVMVFRPDTYHKLYLVIGWGLPLILTVIWAAFTATQQQTSACWWGYNLTPSYWFLEGPRLTIILVNLLYLLNILRVLVTKLRTSQCSEAEQLRKSVKAALVLLPLLGITNALVMVRAPLDRSAFEFALWSYSSHFLTSFQGFFVALLYCFLNGEVRSTLNKKLRNYLTDRQIGTGFLGSRGVSQFHNPSTQMEVTDHHPSTIHHLPHADDELIPQSNQQQSKLDGNKRSPARCGLLRTSSSSSGEGLTQPLNHKILPSNSLIVASTQV